MDFGIGIFAEITALAFEAIASLVEATTALAAGLVELLICTVELAIYVMLWIASPFLPARQRSVKLTERPRRMLRRILYAVLTLVTVFAVVYFFWLREPKTKPQPSPQLSPPSKIETARSVIEKIKDTLPSKSQP